MQRHTPIGFRMRNGKIYVEEEKAKVVKKVFADYLSGISTYAIAKELTAKGFPNAMSFFKLNQALNFKL
jgi:site-specific DNA recombinase